MIVRGGEFGIPDDYVIMAITLVDGDPRELLRDMEKVAKQLMDEMGNQKNAMWGFINDTLCKVAAYLKAQ